MSTSTKDTYNKFVELRKQMKELGNNVSLIKETYKTILENDKDNLNQDSLTETLSEITKEFGNIEDIINIPIIGGIERIGRILKTQMKTQIMGGNKKKTTVKKTSEKKNK
jgi:hypothetical protein